MKISKEIIAKSEKLAKKLNLKFKDITILINALTHRSFLNEVRDFPLPNNERLEFLGDAVLELIISKHLFVKYPERPEGDLTSFRSALVKTTSLAETSDNLNFGEYILMSSGEERTNGRERNQILANTYEAILGAIYIDQNYNTAEKFVVKTLLHKLDKIVENRLDIDSKSQFQEIVQNTLKVTPEYKLVSSSGPDHEKTFIMAAIVEGKELGRGKGNSKQDAEQVAAKKAIKEFTKLYKQIA